MTTYTNALNLPSIAGTVIIGTGGGTGFSTAPFVPPSTSYVNSSPYTVLDTDSVILMDTTLFAAPMSVVLPSAPGEDGQVWTVKDWSGSAATFNITITVTGGGLIDGVSSFVLNVNYQSVSICWSQSKSTYSVVYDYDSAESAGITLGGDIGSISGNSLSVTTGNVTVNSGSSFEFTNFGTSSVLNVTDGNSNTLFGQGAGNLSVSGVYNVGFGSVALTLLTSGAANTAFGTNALTSILTGAYNVGIGYNSGTALTGAESSNVYLNSPGVLGESNTLRIGTATGTDPQDLATAFISGINGNTLGGTPLMVTIDSSTDQLGVIAIPSGIIATINGDSGSITGSSVTIFSNQATLNSGSSISFSNSGTTSTLNLTDNNSNTILGAASGNLTMTGTDNVVVGAGSLTVNTTGNFNIAFGSNVLSSNMAGVGNIGFGVNTLQSNVGGSYNIGLGVTSLVDLVSGSENIAIGRGAGGTLQTGSNDIYIGFNAGTSNIGAESSNIYINNSGAATESNCLRIGNATGTASKDLSTVFIYGINGNTLSGVPKLVTINSSSQLGVSATLATAPPASSTATSGFGSVVLGTAIQNNLGYDIQVNVTLSITAATGATVILGVGPTSTPTTNTYYSSFTTSAFLPFLVTAVVPAGYYLLVNTTGTITVASTTTQVCPL